MGDVRGGSKKAGVVWGDGVNLYCKSVGTMDMGRGPNMQKNCGCGHHISMVPKPIIRVMFRWQSEWEENPWLCKMR